jgi:prepilin peptidase CpaA
MWTDAIPLTAVLVGTGTAAAIDLRSRRVPNVLTALLAGAGVAFAATGLGAVGPSAALAGSLAGLLLMMPGHVFGATGAGDVKLLAAVGTWLGPAVTLRAFVLTMIAGGVFALVVAIYRGRWRAHGDRSFAYAPAVAAGAVLAAVSI